MAKSRLVQLLAEVKHLAKEYRALTGRPLGVTGEVAEYEAAHLLGLELCDARQAGYDAVRRSGGENRENPDKGALRSPGL